MKKAISNILSPKLPIPCPVCGGDLKQEWVKISCDFCGFKSEIRADNCEKCKLKNKCENYRDSIVNPGFELKVICRDFK